MTLSLFWYATECSKFGVGIRVCESKGRKKKISPNADWLLAAMQKQSGI